MDKLSVTAKKFGLGKEVFGNLFDIEKKGLIPNTQWKKNALGQGWLLGETIKYKSYSRNLLSLN